MVATFQVMWNKLAFLQVNQPMVICEKCRYRLACIYVQSYLDLHWLLYSHRIFQEAPCKWRHWNNKVVVHREASKHMTNAQGLEITGHHWKPWIFATLFMFISSLIFDHEKWVILEPSLLYLFNFWVWFELNITHFDVMLNPERYVLTDSENQSQTILQKEANRLIPNTDRKESEVQLVKGYFYFQWDAML